ncbi:MAG: hydroxyectoine utilization dehydratase EutB [Alphaproteobacteria bacterium]|nr:hydroxyectoine utilization dehydratase EutB [Alphaproteobacteria bacterium]
MQDFGVTLEDIKSARAVIRGHADATPLIPSPFLSQHAGGEFLLKLENMQPIGAFKIRGAMTAIAQLDPSKVKGVACCSTGNHGRGVAYAARERGIKAIICMSSLVPKVKVDGIKALGAEVRIIGTSQDDAWQEAERLCREEGYIDVSPFDDRFVIAGQGTIGLELLAARPDLATILVPVSGGGLAGGIALAAKSLNPDIKVIGISMDRGAAMHASIHAGEPVDVEEVASLADSLGGGIGLDNAYSFALCRDLLDDVLLVTEEEIYKAMQALYYEDRIIAEGACVVGIAAMMSGKLKTIETPAAAIITGRNLDMDMFTRIVNGEDVTLGTTRINGSPYGQ